MKDLKDGIRALVRLDFQGRVHKTFRGTDRDKRFARECEVLRILEQRGCDYVPRLLEAHEEELRIVTTSCGAPAPQLSQKKARSLFDALERDYGVRHDDPEPRNVTYSMQMGRFCLIDFELAEILEKPEESTVPDSDVWRVRWQALSEQGSKHEANDDSWLALGISRSGQTLRSELSESLLGPNHLLLGVSDGMGGNAAGELASRLILNWLRQRASEVYATIDQGRSAADALEQILHDAHEGLNRLASANGQERQMGATLALAWITPGKMFLAQIGDSRVYLHRAGETRLLTEDHTIAFREWQAGHLSEYEYRAHPRRAALYDCLGAGHKNLHANFYESDLLSGDQVLICSDGVIDGLWERGISDGLAAEGTLVEKAGALHKRAIENDGRDDSTLILASITRV